MIGTATYGVTGALAGDPDTALGFNGTSTHIVASVPDVASSYSLEAWFKTTHSFEQHIIDLYPQQLRTISGRVLFGTSTNFVESPNTSYDGGKYHHVVATYGGSTRRLYIDGALVASTASSAGSISTTTANIGHYYYGGLLFEGSLDEIAIYGHVLSSAQVLAHYQAGVSSIAPSPTATATPQPNVSTKHVLTADFVSGANGTTVSPSTLGPYLNWAETNWQSNPAVRGAGIKAMLYSDPNRQAAGDALYTSTETTFAHRCSGSRIMGTYNQYLMNPASSTLRSLWHTWIAAQNVNMTWDAIFEDNANDVLNLPALPCNYSADSWLTASQGLNSAQVPTPIIYSGLEISNEIDLNVSSNVIGGMEEGCYSSAVTRPKIWSNYWAPIENNEIAMAQQGKLFICYGNDTTSASSSTDGRLYTYASFLLTYTPTRSILWEYYGTPSHFHVMPESRLVALNPVIPTPSAISGLKLSTGVYGREYKNCYIGGSSVGACAVVVNPDRTYTHNYPYGSKYLHTLKLSGSGVLDGGTISTSGGVPPTSLPALGSVIVFK